MEVDDYRVFITELAKSKTIISGLEKALATERTKTDELITAIKSADVAFEAERKAAEERIKVLEKTLASYKRFNWMPGIIAGIRPDSDWNVEGVIGLGWKIDIIK